MTADTGILVIQVMQLPIVALIIVFSFTTPQPRNNENEWSLHQIGTLLTGTPLRYIAIGLVFNLIYLFLNLTQHPAIGPLPLSPKAMYLLTLGTDILTAQFFLIEAVSWLTRMGRIAAGRLALPGWTFWIFNKRNALAITIIFVCIAGFFRNYDRQHYDFHIFNFLCYLLVGFYVLYKYRRQRANPEVYANYFVFGGFCLWALLQLLGVVKPFMHLSDETIDLIGFGGSLLAKGAILFGLYNFSVKSRTLANGQLEKQNKALEQTLHNNEELQELINEASNVSNLPDLADIVIRHMTSDGPFPYDYAIFSSLDQLEKTIHTYPPYSVNPNIDIQKLLPEDDAPLDSADQRAAVYRSKNVAHVQDGELDRFFIPILDIQNVKGEKHNKEKIQDAKAIAILELGNYREPHRPGATRNAIYSSGQLRIYLDNCVQVYHRLNEKQIEEDIEARLIMAELKSGDDHLEYLTQVLQRMCSYVKADHGMILLLSTNHRSGNPYYLRFTSDLPDAQKEKLRQLLNKKFGNLSPAAFDESLIEGRLTKEVADTLGATSWHLEKDIPFHNQLVGSIFLFSRNPAYFNDRIKDIIRKMAASIAVVFKEKKFHKAVTEAVLPDNAITDPETIIQPIIQLLKEYFSTPYVSIWLRDIPVGPGGRFIQKYASADYKEACGAFHRKIVGQEEVDFTSDYRFLRFSSEDGNSRETEFWDFKTVDRPVLLLQKPLKSPTHEFGFINLYFHRDYWELTNEDAGFLNLMSAKAVMTLQMHNLVFAFREISASLIKNDLNSTLSLITSKAMELLIADPVILYKSRNGEDIFFRDATVSKLEEFNEPAIENLFKSPEDRHVELAERILKDKSMFFNNYKEYSDYVTREPKRYERTTFNRSFWQREGIKAFAAIQLVNKYANKSRPVGVMFINFRRDIVFNDELKRVIETFAALASGSIMNGLSFERNRQYLLENIKQTRPLLGDLTLKYALHDAKKRYREFNSLFMSLLGDLEDQYAFNRLDKKDIRTAIQELKPFLNVVHDQFAKLESFYREDDSIIIGKHDIIRIIRDQVESISAELEDKLVNTVLHFHQPNLEIDCDKTLIGNALGNLLNNAHYALPVRGTLEIRTFDTRDDKIGIQVTDNGKGVNKDIRPRILEPYETDKPDGSGLGLPMTKLTVEKHGGNLTFSTKPGRTTFTITLPKTIKLD